MRTHPADESRPRVRPRSAGIAIFVALAALPLAVLIFPANSESDPSCPSFAGPANDRAKRAQLHDGLNRRPSRVAVLMLENRNYQQVIGSHSAPCINRLAREYTLFTRYYAVAHPSLPNYLALLAGDTFGVQDDCQSCTFDGPALPDQLSAAGISWKAYYQSMPPAKSPTTVTSRYTGAYNPFAHFRTLNTGAARQRIVSFRSLSQDLARRRLPRLAWITPDKLNDGHSASLRQADRYLSRLVPRIIRALGPDGVLYLTWDEGPDDDHAGLGGAPGGGHVPLIAAGGAARRHATVSTGADHYALLRTIEAHFGLPPLRRAASPSTPLL